MPLAIVAPADPIDPPRAVTPLTVSKSFAVLYRQIGLPSNDANARNVPSRPALNTTPGIALTAALMPGCCAIDSCGGRSAYQRSSPSLSLMATSPPYGPLIPKYACSSSAAPPKSICPRLISEYQTTLPLLSGSSAHTAPDF